MGDKDDIRRSLDEDMEQKAKNWENFWETPEGNNTKVWEEDYEEPEKIIKVKPKTMRMLRREEWVRKNNSEGNKGKGDEEPLRSRDALPEDIQNFEVKMVIIGSDVEALYPSLEIDECCKVVEEEVMRSTITWGDIDYLEGARFIALH